MYKECKLYTLPQGTKLKYTVEEDGITIVGIKYNTDCYGDDIYTSEDKGTLIIPETIEEKPVVRIGKEAFWNAVFSGLILPASVYSLGEGVFHGLLGLLHGFTHFQIPDTVTQLNGNPFEGSDVIPTVSMDHPTLAIINGVLYSKPNKRIVYYPNFLIDIEHNNCKGKNTFSNKVFEVPEGILEIGDHAFDDVNLGRIILPKSLKVIGEDAFNMTPLQNIEIPEGVIKIGKCALRCSSEYLTVSLPKSVTEIGTEKKIDDNHLGIFTSPSPYNDFPLHLKIKVYRNSYAADYIKENLNWFYWKYREPNEFQYEYIDAFDWLNS